MWLVVKIHDNLRFSCGEDLITGEELKSSVKLSTENIIGYLPVYNDYEKARELYPDCQIIQLSEV